MDAAKDQDVIGIVAPEGGEKQVVWQNRGVQCLT